MAHGEESCGTVLPMLGHVLGRKSRARPRSQRSAWVLHVEEARRLGGERAPGLPQGVSGPPPGAAPPSGPSSTEVRYPQAAICKTHLGSILVTEQHKLMHIKRSPPAPCRSSSHTAPRARGAQKRLTTPTARTARVMHTSASRVTTTAPQPGDIEEQRVGTT